MSNLDVRIQKRDLPIIALSVAGGFAFVFCAAAAHGTAKGALMALCMGAPAGAGAGVIACLLQRFRESRRARITRFVLGVMAFGGLMSILPHFESPWVRALVAINGVVLLASVLPTKR